MSELDKPILEDELEDVTPAAAPVKLPTAPAPKPSTTSATGGISLAALKELLADQAKQNAEALRTVIEEIKKPTVLEQKELDRQVAELNAKNAERKENAAGILAQMTNKKTLQRICSHKAQDGHTHLVHVQEPAGSGYLLCQKEQCKIRPGVAPKDYKGGDIYDTQLFNELFQTLPSGGDLIY